MKISEAYPGSFLKADDLNGQNVTVTIQAVTLEELGQGRDKESKLVISFVGKEKKMIANKTNATTISKLYGDETEGWVGKKITIGPREVEFSGSMVWAIRVSLQKPGAPASAAPQPARRPVAQQPEPGPAQEQPGRLPADQDGYVPDSDVGF